MVVMIGSGRKVIEIGDHTLSSGIIFKLTPAGGS
jgi:hypothetical protein